MIAIDVMEYNLALEKAQNEALILNILRARDGRPLYFTNLSSFTGSPTASVSLSLSNQKTFGSTGDRVTTWGPSTTVGANTTYNVGVLDTKEFMRGISKPIEPSTFHYLWQSGWPRELVFWLMVRTVTESENGDWTVFRNDPTNLAAFRQFKRRYLSAIEYPAEIQVSWEDAEFSADSCLVVNSFPDALELWKSGLALTKSSKPEQSAQSILQREITSSPAGPPTKSKESVTVTKSTISPTSTTSVDSDTTVKKTTGTTSVEEVTTRSDKKTDTTQLANSEETTATEKTSDNLPTHLEKITETFKETSDSNCRVLQQRKYTLMSNSSLACQESASPVNQALEVHPEKEVTSNPAVQGIGAHLNGKLKVCEDNQRSNPKDVVLLLRSPMEVFSYLGNLLLLDKEDQINICRGATRGETGKELGVPLFSLIETHLSNGKAEVELAYRSSYWHLPDQKSSGSCKGSMQALALLIQLVNLQKATEDLPISGSVNVVGPSRLLVPIPR